MLVDVQADPDEIAISFSESIKASLSTKAKPMLIIPGTR